jgi:isoleucyl-tRNA synthetase
MRHAGAAAESVHLTSFPGPEFLAEGLTQAQRDEAADWTALVPVRDQVLKALDTARESKLIGGSLQASVEIRASGETAARLQAHAVDLPAWFIVSDVRLIRAGDGELTVNVERARGDKCERCWKYKLDVGSNADFPTVCADCARVLPSFLS